MRLGVSRIDKLTGNEAVRDFFRKLVRLCDGALHAFCALGENQFGTVGFHQLSALDRHRFGHHNNDPVASCGGNGGKTDARIARGRLDNHRTGLQLSAFFRVVNHRLGDSVLNGAGGIEIFKLCEDFCF